jgi:hypothetical protein
VKFLLFKFIIEDNLDIKKKKKEKKKLPKIFMKISPSAGLTKMKLMFSKFICSPVNSKMT